MRDRRKASATALVGAIAAIALVASAATERAGGNPLQSYPRDQTLVTSGTQWGEIQGFNPFTGQYATGTIGLCYETLQRYDPLKDRYINWLARSARYAGPKTYVIVLRDGIRWSDGTTLAPRDVVWNFNLGRFQTSFWHSLYANVKSVKTAVSKVRVMVKVNGKAKTKIKKVRNKVVFRFRGTPNYAQWRNLIWNLPIVSRRQASAQIQGQGELATFDPEDPVCTGPYALDVEGFDPTTRVVWKRRPAWWAAKKKLAPAPKPKYIADIVQTNSNAPDPWAPPWHTDLYNAYLPNGAGRAQTYFPSAPYHLQAGLTALVPNTTRRPLSDAKFRTALATAIDIKGILQKAYNGEVQVADPTGLLPAWAKWIDEDIAYGGFSYSTARAKLFLADAGYEDMDGDGLVEDRDGAKIDLEIQVPRGWADWAEARDSIIAAAQTVGIKIHKLEVEYGEYRSNRNSGAFDLVLDNTSRLSDTPWTYFNYLFHQPIVDDDPGQTFSNFSRFGSSPEDARDAARAWNLVKKLDRTPPSKIKAREMIMDELQEITLERLPVIPLWNDSLWAYYNSEYYGSQYWRDWPSSSSGRRYLPTMWRGYLNMTGIDTIDHVKVARVAE